MMRGLLLYFLNFPIHLLGIFYSFVGKQIRYLPTAKIALNRFPIRYLIPHLMLIVASIAGVVFSICFVCGEPCYGMAAFALWNLALVSLALGWVYCAEARVFEKALGLKLDFEIRAMAAILSLGEENAVKPRLADVIPIRRAVTLLERSLVTLLTIIFFKLM